MPLSISYGAIFTSVTGSVYIQQAPMQSKFQTFSLKKASRVCLFPHAFTKEVFKVRLQLVMYEKSSTVSHPQLIRGPSPEHSKSNRIPADRIEEYLSHDLDEALQAKTVGAAAPNAPKGRADLSDREIQRRWKIGLANKGRKPWNKGRQHSQETRERIKKRTIEALSDPKVRKKMSESPHFHSDLSKARIGAALRRLWEKRLEHRKSQDKCYLTWATSIAEAAKEGACDQQELSWDSYEKMKADILLKHLQKESEKARAKEIAKLRADRVAKARAERLTMLAQQRKEKQLETNAMKRKACKKSEDKKREKDLAKSLKIKARLTEFHRRKKLFVSVQKETVIESQPAVEKWDIEHIKTAKMRGVSLANQIRDVKNKKTQCAAQKAQKTASSDSFVKEKDGESQSSLASLTRQEAHYAG